MVEAVPARLLVIDGDKRLLRRIESRLQGEGFTTATASSGRKGIAWLNQHRADLMLLDLELADMHGKEIIDQLAADGKSIPFIIMTGPGKEGLAVEMMKRGSLDYIVKDGQFLQLAPAIVRHGLMEIANDKKLVELSRDLAAKIAALEGLSYSVSHTMEAPLRAIQSYASYLLDDFGWKLNADGLSYLHHIMRSAVRLDGLIQNVVSYSKILQGDLPLQSVDVDRLVRATVELVSEQPTKPEIQILGRLPNVIGNEAMLSECVTCLLSNATKFVSPGKTSRVEISAKVLKDDRVQLCFKDNGIGIAPEEHNRIFGLFEQINPREEYAGVGIGLTIVRKAVERMNAEIGFESELGKGSNFWIQLRTV